MQSKRSCFNKVVFWKMVGRFWPIWFLYGFIWVIILPLSLSGSLRYASYESNSLLYALQEIPLNMGQFGGIFMSGFFACFAAMGVFSYMYSARSVGGFAPLPVKRECLFVSSALAGLLPLLAVNVLVFLISLGIEALHGKVDIVMLLQWLGLVSMMNVCFFGIAAFAGQLTGNVLALPFIYGILNFTVAAIEFLVRNVLSLFVYGMSLSRSALSLDFMSPSILMLLRCRVESETARDALGNYQVLGYFYSGWAWIVGYAALGLLLLFFSVLIYRKRRMETASDIIAIRVVKPIFKYILSAICSLVFGALMYSIFFSGGYRPGTPEMAFIMLLFMFVGCFIGFFAAEMFLFKSIRVFTKRRWRDFGIACAALAVFMACCEFDAFGYEKRVPEAGEIESVTVNHWSSDTIELFDPRNIGAVTDLHRSLVANKGYHEAGYGELDNATVALTYLFTNGKTATRQYRLCFDPESPAGDAVLLQAALNSQEAINYRNTPAFAPTELNIIYSSVDYAVPNPEWEQEAGPYAYDSAAMYAEKYGTKYADPAVYNNLQLTAAEASELWHRCIVPDMAENAIGKAWVYYGDEYYDTVYKCSITIEMRIRSNDGPQYDQRDYITIVPTADSRRTNEWLVSHGIDLHLEREFQVVYKD